VKIGYSVEGSTDRAFLRGLQKRWCPAAELIEGQFRGTSRLSLRREYAKICEELVLKGAGAMVFLTDGDCENWRDVQRNERAHFPEERRSMVVHGVPDRNIECWICADAGFVADDLRTVRPEELRVPDPKGRFESALGIERGDRKEMEIEGLVMRAPLRAWLRNPSFEDFYDQVRALSQRLGCQVPNIWEAESS
jgi:hypothetical protein